MATVSEARLGKWFAEVRADHVAEGVEQERARGLARLQESVEQERARGLARLQQGVEQERVRAFARLRRQVAIKFGERTAERLSALVAGIAAERMERLGDRVSDWIVECERGEDLLVKVSDLVGNGGTEG